MRVFHAQSVRVEVSVLVRYNQTQKCFQNGQKCLIYIAGKQTSGGSRNFQYEVSPVENPTITHYI